MKTASIPAAAPAQASIRRRSFDGNYHTVSGIYISTSDNYQNLFGYVTGASIQHVGVIDSYISGNNLVGGVAGQGAEYNCYNTDRVGGKNVVGGVVAYSTYEVSNCCNTGDITGTTGSVYNTVNVGGVLGISCGGICNCYNTGAISGSGTAAVADTNGSGYSSDAICVGATLSATPNTTPDTDISYQWEVSADGTFGLHGIMTCELAMAIAARAMKITGLDVPTSTDSVASLLAGYADGTSVSSCAGKTEIPGSASIQDPS